MARPRSTFNLMVDGPSGVGAVFHALAHDARRDMLGRLASGELTVGELAEPLAMSLAAASKHVKVLERAGLVRRTVEGRRHVCRLEAAPLASAAGWLRFYERFWAERLDALETLLEPGPEEEEEEEPMTRKTNFPAVRLQRTIPAPPHAVYRAWLEPDLVRQWMAPGSLEVKRVEIDERVGGRYSVWQTDSGAERPAGSNAKSSSWSPTSASSFGGASWVRGEPKVRSSIPD